MPQVVLATFEYTTATGAGILLEMGWSNWSGYVGNGQWVWVPCLGTGAAGAAG